MKTKKAFVLLEILIALTLVGVIYLSVKPNTQHFKSTQFAQKLNFYIKQVRLKALLDDKFQLEDNLWHKKMWTIKFLRCRNSVGGYYFSIYSDVNMTGKINKEDSYIDKLSNTYMYSSNYCNESTSNNSDVLITKNYNISSINITCNDTQSKGQLSFDANSRVYSKLSNNNDDYKEYLINGTCSIELVDKYGLSSEIVIDGITGYSYVK